MNEINVIRRELRALGITRRCRCYGRIVMAIQLAVDQEDSLEAVTKEIYWEVGSRCGRKWTAVERNIRTAVQIAWRTNPELLREHGVEVGSVPSAEAHLQQGCTVTYVAIDGVCCPPDPR